MGYIQKIRTNIPNSDRFVDTDVKGRNLIFTGGNGCGKTQLLNHLFQDLEKRIVQRQNYNEKQLIQNISSFEKKIGIMSKADSQYESFEINISKWKSQLEETRNPPVVVEDLEQFVIRFHEHKALFSKFDATRQANIRKSKAAVSKEDLIEQANSNTVKWSNDPGHPIRVINYHSTVRCSIE